MFADVESYANENGLSDEIELLKKGALVAQRPLDFETIPELDDVEKDYLRKEITNKWHHPKTLYLLIALNSIGAAIQGWDRECGLGLIHALY